MRARVCEGCGGVLCGKIGVKPARP
jgi:hypothetical protein